MFSGKGNQPPPPPAYSPPGYHGHPPPQGAYPGYPPHSAAPPFTAPPGPHPAQPGYPQPTYPHGAPPPHPGYPGYPAGPHGPGYSEYPAGAQPGYPQVPAGGHPGYPGAQPIYPHLPSGGNQQYPQYPGHHPSAPPASKPAGSAGSQASPAGSAAPSGHFYIESALNKLVLDVTANSTAPGTEVKMYTKKPKDSAANQLWYVDQPTSTIRSKMSGMCLEVTDNGLVVRPYNPGNKRQKLKVAGASIELVHEHGKVLDIQGSNKDAGAKVVAYARHGQPNQRWRLEHVQPDPPKANLQKFYLKSALNGKVLDVQGANKKPGTKAIMYARNAKKTDNQLWTLHPSAGVIQSALTGYALDTSGGAVTLQPYNPTSTHQQWRLRGELIVNDHFPGNALDIKAANKADGAELIVYGVSGGPNQRWIAENV